MQHTSKVSSCATRSYGRWRKSWKTAYMFQKKLLRRIINDKWPRTISNKDLNAQTKMKPWNITIQRRRLAWFGHLMRLPAKTPARKALKAFINPVKKPPERQKMTRVSQVLKEIKLLTNLPLKDDITKNIEIPDVECSDRGDWRSVSSMMLTRLTKMQWRKRNTELWLAKVITINSTLPDYGKVCRVKQRIKTSKKGRAF